LSDFTWAGNHPLFDHELYEAWYEEHRARGGDVVFHKDGGPAIRFEYQNPALQNLVGTLQFFAAVKAGERA
jgi:hypothetical protein